MPDPLSARTSPRTSPRSALRPALVAGALGGLFFASMLGIRGFLVEAFRNPTPSMEPALYRGDHFFVSKLPHRPQRGEVVVFRYPPDPSIEYVKRVVGLAGDTVQLAGGHLLVNGVDLSRREPGASCASEGQPDAPASGEPCEVWSEAVGPGRYRIFQDAGVTDFGPFTVPETTVFVLGDNRGASSDSRMWGPVPLRLVKGVALFVWWSNGPRGVRWDRLFTWVR